MRLIFIWITLKVHFDWDSIMLLIICFIPAQVRYGSKDQLAPT